MSRLIQPGDRHAGFILQESAQLPHINCKMLRLEHQATGARLIHLESRDDNNLFAVGFRTPPQDSTGVAHILEHSALCGSRRFPVRDPFFSMIKRSLNSFMNAMTAGDWTLYPFASQNRKDYYNLLGIYLDAAFFPLLRERDFLQEGHRLEYAPSGELCRKGVVYNEMKGAMADPSSLLSRRLNRALYPGTTYGHNSGGEPADIPELTHEQLREFHRRHYHPGNAYFFSYGNLPLEEQLEVIEREALRHFGREEVDSEVPPETGLAGPKVVTETYALEPGLPLEGKSMVQLGWLCCDINENFERLALSLLSSLLLGNPAAPLYKALLDSRLGSNLAPGAGYQDDYRTTCFAAGLQGTDPQKAEAIEALVLKTLEEAAGTGFSKERIEAAIHRLEFSNREVTGDSYPYGLLLLMRLLGPWIHGGSPLAALQFDEDLARIRAEVAKGPFFGNLIRTRLLDNPRRVRLCLRPDSAQGAREEAAEREKLDGIEGGLSEADRLRIRQQARELQQAQEAQEDLSCLPTLELSDIPEQEPQVKGTRDSRDALAPRLFEQPTNGIGYFTLHAPIEGLPEALLPFVPLYCALLPQVGAAGRSYLEMAERIEAHTGGIRLSASVLESPLALNAPLPTVILKGKALNAKQEMLFEILQEMMCAPDFLDLDRLHKVIGQIRISLENSVPSSGHSYAARHAASRLTPGARLRETWSGIEQIRFVKQIAEKAPEELKDLGEKLDAIGRFLLRRGRVETAVTAEAGALTAIAPRVRELLRALPEGKSDFAAGEDFAPVPLRRGWAASVPVSYVTCVLSTVPFEHEDSAGLQVLAKLLKSGYLHREIREKGGAYGGMASYDSEAGLFAMLSYRDPRLEETLEVFEKAVDWAVAGRFTDEDIKEAILALFSDLDRPLSPGGRGSREFANLRQGLSLEMRNRYRARLLALGREELTRSAKLYLRDGWERRSVTVISSEEALKKATRTRFEILRI